MALCLIRVKEGNGGHLSENSNKISIKKKVFMATACKHNLLIKLSLEINFSHFGNQLWKLQKFKKKTDLTPITLTSG